MAVIAAVVVSSFRLLDCPRVPTALAAAAAGGVAVEVTATMPVVVLAFFAFLIAALILGAAAADAARLALVLGVAAALCIGAATLFEFLAVVVFFFGIVRRPGLLVGGGVSAMMAWSAVGKSHCLSPAIET